MVTLNIKAAYLSNGSGYQSTCVESTQQYIYAINVLYVILMHIVAKLLKISYINVFTQVSYSTSKSLIQSHYEEANRTCMHYQKYLLLQVLIILDEAQKVIHVFRLTRSTKKVTATPHFLGLLNPF